MSWCQSSTSLLCFLLQLFLRLMDVQGRGHLALKLTEYKHRTPGTLSSGECCDGVAGNDCSTAVCDPYFVIRITEANLNTQSLDILYHTDTVHNAETINFTNVIGTTLNPVNNSINIWPGMAEIHVTIMDNNTGSGVPDGVIANLTASFSREHQPLLQNATEFSPVAFLNDHFTLKATLNVRCDVYYTYDGFCSLFCQPGNSTTRHVACNHQGNGHCLPGWGGDPTSGCTQPTTCFPNPCLNGATCLKRSSSVVCRCPPGFSGQICENNLSAASTTSPPSPQGASTHSPGHGQGAGTTSRGGGGGGGSGITGRGSGIGSGSTIGSGNGAGINPGGGSINGNGGHGNGGSPVKGSGGTGAGNGTGSGNSLHRGSGHAPNPAGGGDNDDKDGSDVGPIIGGVVGGLAALALLTLLLFLLYRRRKREKEVKPEEQEDTVEEVTSTKEGEQAENADSSAST